MKHHFQSTYHSAIISPQTRYYIPPKFRMDPLNGVNVRDVSIEELQLLFANEAFTCAEYTQYCIDRIEKVKSFESSQLIGMLSSPCLTLQPIDQ